jgi:hypothetical protein
MGTENTQSEAKDVIEGSGQVKSSKQSSKDVRGYILTC